MDAATSPQGGALPLSSSSVLRLCSVLRSWSRGSWSSILHHHKKNKTLTHTHTHTQKETAQSWRSVKTTCTSSVVLHIYNTTETLQVFTWRPRWSTVLLWCSACLFLIAVEKPCVVSDMYISWTHSWCMWEVLKTEETCCWSRRGWVAAHSLCQSADWLLVQGEWSDDIRRYNQRDWHFLFSPLGVNEDDCSNSPPNTRHTFTLTFPKENCRALFYSNLT